MDGNCGNVIAFGMFFIPSLIGINSLTMLFLKSCCMSVTGLNSFESSYLFIYHLLCTQTTSNEKIERENRPQLTSN